MNRYRLELLRREFPFIDHLGFSYESNTFLKPEEIDEIKIKKGDRALLSKKGFVDSYIWSGGGHCDYTAYVAIEGGQIIQTACAGHSGTGSGKREEWKADTIGEQLLAKGVDPDYIVECVQNDHDNNGNGTVIRFWTIFKMKRFDLVGYHQQKIDEAAAALKEEIALICSQV